MEAFLADTEESTDDSPGRKKSKLKSLKTRLFGKSKKAGETSSRKLSQSASDITAAEELGSNEDLLCNQGVMGSRALSHDSIFLADQALIIEAEPTRVLSQENVHSKIKALQEKLQQQKFHLGPPPMIPPIKRSDETSHSNEDVQDQSEMKERNTTTQDNLIKDLSQWSANPILPTSALTKPAPPKSNSPIDEAALDLSAPAQFIPSLNTSAARHRLSVKPRNQRASSRKKHSTVDSTSLISDLTNSETLKEEDGQPDIQEEPEREVVDFKPNETRSVLSEPTKPESTSKTPDIASPQQDIAIIGKMPTVTTQILRPKSHRPAAVMHRPHSSFIPSEETGKSESSGSFDIQFLRDTQNKTWATEMKTKIVSADPKSVDPGLPLRSTVVPDEIKTAGIKRPLPGSGSFHLSVSASKRKEEEERPRSGSFTGVREHTWIKTGKKQLDTSFPNISPKVDLKPSGASLNLGREKTWVIKDSLRKVDSVTESNNKITDTGDAEAAKEVEEEERKTTFGIKLRSTSQSVRLRAETASNEYSRSAATEDKKQDESNNVDQMSKKTTCTTEETKPDVSTAPPAANVPTKPTPPVNPPLGSAEAQPAQVKGVPKAPQGPQPHATTEVSWMSMAMEKTKSLQNLFTSKFPKDLTGGQTASFLQKTQSQTLNQALADTQTQGEKSTTKQLTDAAKTEIHQDKSSAQTVKQSLPLTTAQQNTPKASPFKEAQIKTTVSLPTSTATVTQSVTQGNVWTSQSPLRSVRHVESTLSSPRSTSHQPLWSTRSLKTTGFAVTPSSQDTTPECRTCAASMEESEEQPVWGRSISKKAVFLERRAEWTSPPVEVKKNETQSEPSAQSKETKASMGSETKHTETASKKIPERPKEEKWPRKTPDPCSPPSPSSTPSSSLQSLSDSGELSWIELAKRKSMAWNDKTMD